MKSSKTALYEALKRQILTLELAPDEDLDETSLSEQYGISRTPVRDVFRQLAREGYVDIRENRGARVIPMSHARLRDFFLVAPMIYAAVGRLAAQNFKAPQLSELRRCQERFRSSMNCSDAEGMVLANNRFHEIIGEMADNAFLKPSLERLLIDHARIGHTFFRPKNDEMNARLLLACKHHDLFIEAIAGHNEQAVVDLVFEHWELSRRDMEMFIAPKGLTADALVPAPNSSMESVSRSSKASTHAPSRRSHLTVKSTRTGSRRAQPN
jgi:DNA-binding GntR family transcriptional regulator